VDRMVIENTPDNEKRIERVSTPPCIMEKMY
jgi:hypothetical protein